MGIHMHRNVQVQVLPLPLLQWWSPLKKQKKRKRKGGRKEDHKGSCLSLTERTHTVCVRHSLPMADSYMMVKSLQIFCILKAMTFF